MKEEKQNRKRPKIEISLPKDLLESVKKEKEDLGRYIESLIKEDQEMNREPTDQANEKGEELESTMRREEKRQEMIDNAMLEFMKRYREEEWIEYMLESRGKEAIEEEARRIVEQNPEEWSEFLSEYSK